MMDDDFGEGEECDMSSADLRKASEKLAKDGYRIGKAAEEEKLMQIGFDDGFGRGMALGNACGRLYGVCAAYFTDSVEDVERLHCLQHLLYEVIPEGGKLEDHQIAEIRRLIGPMSSRLDSHLREFVDKVGSLCVGQSVS